MNEIVAPLLSWGVPQLRDLPWRATRDRWAVLVSEVMAQQTQVSRVVPKWQQFMQRWPTPADCAQAPLADVLRLWSGLGYPRRCRNLHLAACTIVERHDGTVPGDLDSLLALPGVGPYTARAVMAFADAADVAVVDTNVARVLARVRGLPLTARESQRIADSLVPRDSAWEWNQVIMDFGAQVCVARTPKCGECAIAKQCATRARAVAWSAVDDPARSTALTSKPQARFDGSDRQARGRLLKKLTEQGVRANDVADVMRLSSDSGRAERLLHSLVRDGLVAIDGDWCRLA